MTIYLIINVGVSNSKIHDDVNSQSRCHAQMTIKGMAAQPDDGSLFEEFRASEGIKMNEAEIIVFCKYFEPITTLRNTASK